MKKWFPILMLALLVSASPAQTRSSSKQTTVDLVADVANLLAKKMPTQADLRAGADRLAKTYRTQLKTVPQQVHNLVAETEQKLDGLELQQKLNLALELWRVRASLNLLALTSPEVIHEFTGLTVPDLKKLSAVFWQSEARVESVLPSWALPAKS
jgi:hypothetical protein